MLKAETVTYQHFLVWLVGRSVGRWYLLEKSLLVKVSRRKEGKNKNNNNNKNEGMRWETNTVERERRVLCNKHTRQTRLLGSFKSHAHKDRIAGYRLPLSRRCHERRRRRRRRRREPRDEEAAARRPTDRPTKKGEKRARVDVCESEASRWKVSKYVYVKRVCVRVCLSFAIGGRRGKRKETVSRLLPKRWRRETDLRQQKRCSRLTRGGPRTQTISTKKKVARPTRQLFLCNHPPPPPGTFALLPKEEEEEEDS